MGSTLTLRISNKMKQDLQKIAREQGFPLSELMRDSLERILLLYKFDTLRKRIVPQAEKNRILTDEDVFQIKS